MIVLAHDYTLARSVVSGCVANFGCEFCQSGEGISDARRRVPDGHGCRPELAFLARILPAQY